MNKTVITFELIVANVVIIAMDACSFRGKVNVIEHNNSNMNHDLRMCTY